MPSEHCQSPLRHLERNLDHQHQSLRQRKLYRYSRNPIVSSPQYQAYRARQSRDGNQEDAKWPEILEAAFLDALIDIPAMGRRKFSYKGKPHGRNELIKEYIWIAYLQSLAPGQRPDPSMARDRKQVSSHIQVLKGFLKDHPAFGRLFPSNKTSKNGFEDSFKNDPCLRALSQGRLPSRRYEHCSDLSDVPPNHQQPSVKPAVFWLLVTSAQIQEDCGDLYEMDTVTHRYSRLSGQSQHVNLDSILNWRQKFPYLEPLCNASELYCDIIHMDVSLNLMETHAQVGADLVTRSEISVANQGNETNDWQTVTSFMKPPELSQGSEQHLDTTIAPTKVLFSNANETRLKVRFPAEEWASILTRLTDLQLKYEGAESSHTFGKGRFLDSGRRPMQEYLQKISMYQEVQSCPSPGMPFLRRAIILWTFREATSSENAATTWRYVDAPMSQAWMSPSSSSSQQLSAASTDNFNAWITSTSQLQLQHQDVLDPYVRGLVTPPSTAGLHSNFVSEAYGYHDQRFNVYPENFSFASTSTAHTEPAFRDDNITTNIDAYLSNVVDARIGCFGNNPTNWNLSNTESVNAGLVWPNYATLPPSSPHVGGEGDVINHGWHIDMDPRLTNWTENRDGKGDWAEMAPTKQKAVNFEQSGDKLQCWLDPANIEAKGIFVHSADEAQIPKLPPRPMDARDTSWIENDSSFDFNQLVEQMRT